MKQDNDRAGGGTTEGSKVAGIPARGGRGLHNGQGRAAHVDEATLVHLPTQSSKQDQRSATRDEAPSLSYKLDNSPANSTQARSFRMIQPRCPMAANREEKGMSGYGS